MSSTRTLASYISKLKYEDLPKEIIEKGKLAILDALGNCIGGYHLNLSRAFLDIAEELGGGREQATIIGNGVKVSASAAAFANGALSTMLDYCDYTRSDSSRCATWLGAMAVPAALAAGESRGISGKELITSVVAGYEGSARIVHSMDMSLEQSQKLSGETPSTFAATCAAGRALGLSEDQMVSAIGMSGIYTPVPAWYKWIGDDGLTPRKDIKQGWAWMCMTGTFSAVSAQKGLKMLQQNNILDGERGLWVMVGMDIFDEKRLTEGLGERYYLPEFTSKIYPGCAVTHTAIEGVTNIAKEHSIAPGDIERIEVITNEQDGIGFDDQEPVGLSDMEFSMPYQVAASLVAGAGGPNWYTQKTANSPELTNLSKRVVLSFDEECEKIFRESHTRMCKVTVHAKSGQSYSRRVDRVGEVTKADDVKSKFVTTASQVIDSDRVNRIVDAVDSLDSAGNVSELIKLLSPLPSETR